MTLKRPTLMARSGSVSPAVAMAIELAVSETKESFSAELREVFDKQSKDHREYVDGHVQELASQIANLQSTVDTRINSVIGTAEARVEAAKKSFEAAVDKLALLLNGNGTEDLGIRGALAKHRGQLKSLCKRIDTYQAETRSHLDKHCRVLDGTGTKDNPGIDARLNKIEEEREAEKKAKEQERTSGVKTLVIQGLIAASTSAIVGGAIAWATVHYH